MKEEARRQRQTKLQGALQITAKLLKCALSAFNDANLYSNEEQEHQIDTLVTRIEDILRDLQTEVPAC